MNNLKSFLRILLKKTINLNIVEINKFKLFITPQIHFCKLNL